MATILFAHQNLILAEAACHHLDQKGTLLIMATVTEARALLAQNKIDLLVLDFFWPDEDTWLHFLYYLQTEARGHPIETGRPLARLLWLDSFPMYRCRKSGFFCAEMNQLREENN